jgi:hypothetical protein
MVGVIEGYRVEDSVTDDGTDDRVDDEAATDSGDAGVTDSVWFDREIEGGESDGVYKGVNVGGVVGRL